MNGIAICDICKSYGAQKVLSGFSARIAAGEAVALMGPSGSGKTTLSRILMGLEKPDSGTIDCPPDARFSAVFQEDRLCENLSAVANVALVLPRGHEENIAAALAGVGLGQEAQRKKTGPLSGGEKRRVALVRAMASPSDIVVLDEAFKGLDAGSRAQAYRYIKQQLCGRTLLLITHDAAEAEAFGARVIPIPTGGPQTGAGA